MKQIYSVFSARSDWYSNKPSFPLEIAFTCTKRWIWFIKNNQPKITVEMVLFWMQNKIRQLESVLKVKGKSFTVNRYSTVIQFANDLQIWIIMSWHCHYIFFANNRHGWHEEEYIRMQKTELFIAWLDDN